MEAEARQKLVDQGKQLKEQLAGLEVELDSMEAALQQEGQKLPNSSHPDVRTPLSTWLEGLRQAFASLS